MHVKAVLYDTWHLTSGAGNVRIEMPPKTRFNLDADAVSGTISVERDDIQKPASEIHELQADDAGLSKPSVKQHLAALRMLFDWGGQPCA